MPLHSCINVTYSYKSPQALHLFVHDKSSLAEAVSYRKQVLSNLRICLRTFKFLSDSWFSSASGQYCPTVKILRRLFSTLWRNKLRHSVCLTLQDAVHKCIECALGSLLEELHFQTGSNLFFFFRNIFIHCSSPLCSLTIQIQRDFFAVNSTI